MKANGEGSLTDLRKCVEKCLGHTIRTSRHFNQLRQSIYERTGELLGATTLKRIWGYINDQAGPRQHTLDVLCRYSGWPDWQTFVSSCHDTPESGPIQRPHIDVGRQLAPGAGVIFSWAPDRECRVSYIGNDEFIVDDSRNTRLRAGDRFRCPLIIADEPLYLDHLTRGSADLGVYVCGRNTGIRFSLISGYDKIGQKRT